MLVDKSLSSIPIDNDEMTKEFVKKSHSNEFILLFCFCIFILTMMFLTVAAKNVVLFCPFIMWYFYFVQHHCDFNAAV